MKAAILAAMSLMLMAGATLPASADTTVVQTTTTQSTVDTTPSVIIQPSGDSGWTTRELTFPVTYPGTVVQFGPPLGTRYAFDYGSPKMDYSADFTMEPFWIYGDIMISGG